MDWSETIEKEREMLKRIIALFCALARLTDGLCNRSYPVRCFILWLLKPAVAIALDCIADDGGPVHQKLVWERTDSIAEARRYSRCFRTAARSMKREFKAFDRYQAYEDGDPIFPNRPPHIEALSRRRFAGLMACLRNVAIVQAGPLCDASAAVVLLEPELRDTS